MIDPGAAGRPQAGAEDVSVQMPTMPPAMVAEHQHRLHQHVREVDLVDAAEELDDRRAPGAVLLASPVPKNE